MVVRKTNLVGSANAQAGLRGKPFFALLTHTSGTVRSFTTDQSGAALDATWTPGTASGAAIYNITISIEDSDVNEAGSFGVGWAFSTTALTNGLKIGVKNAAGTKIVDITETFPLKTNLDMWSFCTTAPTAGLGIWQVTDATSEILLHFPMECMASFGQSIYVPPGGKFYCTLNDNFVTASVNGFSISIKGQYI
jgi:hypothetical protein